MMYNKIHQLAILYYLCSINSLAPMRCGNNLKNIIYEHMLGIKLMSISCEIALGWMSQNTFDEKSTLV